MKKFTSLVLAVCVLAALLAPLSIVLVSAATQYSSEGITNESDARVSKMISAIDNQTFPSHISKATVKNIITHFVYNSKYAAIKSSYFPYPNNGSYVSNISDGVYSASFAASKGCAAYGRYISAVIYGDNNTGAYNSTRTIIRDINSPGNVTASNAKELISKYAQTGDRIRFDEYYQHTLLYVSCDDNGFYFLEYNGDNLHTTSLSYVTWTHFANRANMGTYEVWIYNPNTCTNNTSSSPTPHTHSYIYEYETAHPHKQYKKCSGCGTTSYTGETTTVSGCAECYPEVCTCSSSYAGEYICATTSGPLNIRSGHGTSYASVGTIPHGATVTVTKANGTWAHVTYNGISGYSSLQYLSKKETNAGIPTVTASASYQDITVTWNKVNNATHYDVYLIQSPWGWGDVKNHIQVGATTTTCTFTSVAPGEYSVFVIARPNSDSAQSNWASVTSVAKVGKPTVSVSVDKTNATVSWTAAANAEYYDVYLSQDSTGIENWKYHFRASNTQLSHTFTNVTIGDYLVIVVAGSAHDSQRSDGHGCYIKHFVLDGILYEVDGGGDASVVGCDTSLSGDLVVPENANGYPVIAIMDYAFDGCEKLTSIKLSKTIYGVQSYAFTGCTSLSSIVVEEGNPAYSSLDGVLFLYGNKLHTYPAGKTDEAYTIPEFSTSIGEGAFNGNQFLAQLTIPDSVTSIGNKAFVGCNNLTIYGFVNSVAQVYSAENDIPFVAIEEEPEILTGTTGDCIWTLDGTVLTISGNGAMADYDWEKLAPWGREITSVVIENGVTNIGKYAFFGCARLTAINIADSVTSIGGGAFFECTTLASVEIPDSVTSIGGEAFYGCTSLTSVTIPDGVTYIGFVAFDCCDNLTTISVSPSNTEYSSLDGVLFDKNQTTLICCPAEKVGSYTIPGSVINIEPRAFHNCDGLSSVTIPNSVNSIGGNAFWGCTGLTAVTLPNGITTLWYGTFNGCTNLTSVTIPGSVTSIDTGAFDGCENLTIYGYTGSAAETYAAENDIPFVALADVEGDIDGDGVLGIGDLTLFAQLISGWTTNDGCELFDYDGDGVCTIGDLTFLSKFMSGWEDAQTYQLIFDAAEGTCDLTEASAICGKEFGNLPTPKRVGFEFIGWHTEDGTLIQSSDLAPIHFRPVILVAKWKENPVSDWVLASEVPEDSLIVDEKWTYDKTQWITSNSSSVSGYTLDSTKTTSAWGEYGNWSNWSNSAVSASDSRQVETQTIGATYKTQYNYSKYAQTSSGGGYSGPWAGTWGGIKCQYYTERGWTDSALSAYSSQTVGGTTFYLYGKSGDTWYNETTRQVVVTEAYTQYRYRDRTLVYTYHLFKVEKNESEAEVVASDTVSNVQKWVRYRAK